MLVALCCLWGGFALQLAPGATPRVAGVQKIAEDDGVGRKVVIVPIEGTIDLGLPAFLRRVIAEHPDAAAIVLDIDTFGGRVDAAVQIRDALLAAKPPVVAWVDQRAISAGALITYAADQILFAPGSTMGAATPVTLGEGEIEAADEKVTSYMRAEMRTTAEANGRRPDIAEAMVDRTLGVEGIVQPGKLLTLTTEDAVRVGLADGTAGSLAEVLDQLGLPKAERVVSDTTWAEDLARIFTDPTVASLLMSLGMLGLLVELYTPGFGIAGVVGVTCLALFFGGHMLADLAGWEELLLLSGGLALLAAEIFFIPGFGVAGVAGIVLVVVALSLSLVGLPIDVSWSLGYLGDAVGRVILSLAGTILGLGLVARFFPARALPGWLVLRERLSSGLPVPAVDVVRSNPGQEHLLGKRGEALTDLRLSGKARIEGHLVDVVSLHEYLEAGTPIEVVEVEGARVVVTRASPLSPPAPQPAP